MNTCSATLGLLSVDRCTDRYCEVILQPFIANASKYFFETYGQSSCTGHTPDVSCYPIQQVQLRRYPPYHYPNVVTEHWNKPLQSHSKFSHPHYDFFYLIRCSSPASLELCSVVPWNSVTKFRRHKILPACIHKPTCLLLGCRSFPNQMCKLYQPVRNFKQRCLKRVLAGNTQGRMHLTVRINTTQTGRNKYETLVLMLQHYMCQFCSMKLGCICCIL